MIEDFPWLEQKKVLVFYAKPFGMKFAYFPRGNDLRHPNVHFFDMDLTEQDYFVIDKHLTKSVHQRIATILAQWLEEREQ